MSKPYHRRELQEQFSLVWLQAVSDIGEYNQHSELDHSLFQSCNEESSNILLESL